MNLAIVTGSGRRAVIAGCSHLAARRYWALPVLKGLTLSTGATS